MCVCVPACSYGGGEHIGDTAARVCAPHCLFNVWKCMCIFKVGGLNLFLFPPVYPSPLPLSLSLPPTSFLKLIDLWMHDRWRERVRQRERQMEGVSAWMHTCMHRCVYIYIYPFLSNTCYKVTNTHMHAYKHTLLTSRFMHIPT